MNLIQASVNQSHSLLGYVTKKISEEPCGESTKTAEVQHTDHEEHEIFSEYEIYHAFIVEFSIKNSKIHLLETEKSKQLRIQFLYREKVQPNFEKFLLLVHQECQY